MNASLRRMVRVDLLRPGDIILLKSHGFISELIARATAKTDRKRRYSHAALVVSGQLWFESNDDGVGYLFKRLTKVEDHNGEVWRLVDVSNYPIFDEYRHSQLHQQEDVSQDFDLASVIQAILGRWTGLQYPPLRRLSRASPLFEKVPGAKRLFGDIVDLTYQILFKLPGVLAPGPFCSELVVRAYGELEKSRPECAILKARREPRSVSPSDLADSSMSALEHRPEIVVVEDTDSPDCRTQHNFYMDEINEKTVLLAQTAIWRSVPTTAVHRRVGRKLRQFNHALLDRLNHRLRS
jgi:hypothetical protein